MILMKNRTKSRKNKKNKMVDIIPKQWKNDFTLRDRRGDKPKVCFHTGRHINLNGETNGFSG
jgi:hypothetical protein